MARKGNFRGKGFEKNGSVDNVASSESTGMPSRKMGSRSATSAINEGSGSSGENAQNIDCPDNQSNVYRNKSQRSRGSGDGKQGAAPAEPNIAKGRTSLSGQQPGTKLTSSKSKEASTSKENGGQRTAGDGDGTNDSEAMEYEERLINAESCSGDIPSPTQATTTQYSEMQESMENGMHVNSQQVEGNENDKSKFSCASTLLRQASEWIQRQKPVLTAFIAAILQARDFIVHRFQHTWPIVCTWLLHLGRLFLLLFILWLDCCLRGMDSFLRLGTSSLFVVIWCSFLSFTAMAGIFNAFLSLGVACTMAFVFGYTASVLTTAVIGMVVLWIDGSFWMTSLLIIAAGLTFALNHEHLALLITIMYSIYSAKFHVGWLGMVLCMNLAFISSDILNYFLKNNANEAKERGFNPQSEGTNGRGRNFSHAFGYSGPHGEEGNFASARQFGESSQYSQSGDGERGPSTSGLAGGDPSSEEEVFRLLDSPDHYAVLGLSRYENIDVTVLKKEYRKKAMLVHPDKNMGNVKAEEAFKKLQNAYEVLLDSVKRKIYDDELRREELVSHLRRFRSGVQRSGRHRYGRPNAEDERDGLQANSRRIACKKCNGSHIWIHTDRTKARARWCQDCQDYHPAKDGDGWVEQTGHAFLFGMLRKVDTPRAYACVESKVYDATEWAICQGMKCPPNTHKPTFHVNTTLIGKDYSRGSTSTHKAGTNADVPTNLDENMTEEEFFDWFQNAVASGMFETSNGVPENAGMKTGNHAKNSKKKRKGKKQW